LWHPSCHRFTRYGTYGSSTLARLFVGRAWWRLREVLVAIDGSRADAKLAADVPEIRPGEVEAADVPPLLDEALVPLARRLLYLPIVRSWTVRHDRPGSEVLGVAFLLGLSIRRCRPAENGPFLKQIFFQREREVVQQVPAVRHVRRAGSALGQPFPVDVGAVPGRHLHPRTGMAPEPGHEALLRALRKQIHDPTVFEVYEDRAVGAAFLEREVVHAENPDPPDLRHRGALDPLQQGVTSGDDPQFQGQPGARPAAELEGDREQGLLQPHGLAGAG